MERLGEFRLFVWKGKKEEALKVASKAGREEVLLMALECPTRYIPDFAKVVSLDAGIITRLLDKVHGADAWALIKAIADSPALTEENKKDFLKVCPLGYHTRLYELFPELARL